MAAPRAKLLYQNHGLRATWTASSAVATLPASNLGVANRGRPWRATGKTSEWVKADLGGAKAVGAVAIVGSNLTSGASVTVQANTTDSWGTPAFSQAMTPWASDTGVIVLYLATEQTYRWWRLTLADAANSAAYIEIGVVALGPVLDMGGVPDGLRFSLVDPSPVGYAPGGTAWAWALPAFRRVVIPYRYLTETAAFSAVLSALKATGRREEMVLSLFGVAPDEDDLAKETNLYGRLEDLGDLVYARNSDLRYDWQIAFRESR